MLEFCVYTVCGMFRYQFVNYEYCVYNTVYILCVLFCDQSKYCVSVVWSAMLFYQCVIARMCVC